MVTVDGGQGGIRRREHTRTGCGRQMVAHVRTPAVHIHRAYGSKRRRVVRHTGANGRVIGHCSAAIRAGVRIPVGVERNPFDRPPATSPVVTLLEHDLVVRVEHPVVRLPVLASLCGQLHEALVEREVVADGVSPALVLPVSVVREVLCDIVVDTVESESLLRASLNGHADESHVGVRRLDVQHLLLTIISVDLIQSDSSRRDGSNRLWRALRVLAHG